MRTPFVSAFLTVLTGATLAAAQLPDLTGPPETLPTPQPMQPFSLPPPGPILPLPGDIEPPPDEGPPPDGGLFDFAKVFLAPRFWVSGSYLYWWLNEPSLPPLITRGSPNDPLPGVIGQPNTVQLFGGPFSNEAHSGARFSAGLGLNPANTIAIEGSFLFLPRFSLRPSPVPLNGQVLARPFIDAVSGAQSAVIISSPSLVGGGVTALYHDSLFGFELNARASLYRDTCWYLSMIGGFRQLQLSEGLEIDAAVPIVPTVPVFGADRLLVTDQFATRNNFLGGQFGLECEYNYERLVVGVRAKVALGSTHEVVNIRGLTTPVNTVGPAAAPPPIPSGLLAMPTNIGDYTRDRWTALPEFNVSVGWRLTDHLRLDVGYTFLYWAGVVQAADQIDRVVNASQIPTSSGLGVLTGPARPAFLGQSSNLWIQGMNFSLELRY